MGTEEFISGEINKLLDKLPLVVMLLSIFITITYEEIYYSKGN